MRSRNSRKSRRSRSGCKISKFLDGCNPRLHRYRANPVGARGLYILRRIADQRYRRAAFDPAACARFTDGQFRQPRAILRHLSEGAEPEVSVQTGAFQLAPSDARQIPGDQSQQDAAARQPLQHRHHARAMFVAQFRAHAQVVALRRLSESPAWPAGWLPGGRPLSASSRSECPDPTCLVPGCPRWWFQAGDPPDSVDQRRPMVRSGTPNQSAVDIE